MPPKLRVAPAKSSTARVLMDTVNQQFGAGTLKWGSDPQYKVEYLPTGLAPIDDLLVGGLPYGRSVMIHGDYSTLKTYIGLCSIAQAQQRGQIAALIDTERSFDPEWAKSLGVDLDALILPPPDRIETGEKAIDISEILIRNGVDLLLFDSVAAALPKAEHEKKMEDSVQMLRQATMMTKALRKLTAANRKTAILWINQTRVNPNVMFGNPEAIPGGKALAFYSTYILGLYKGSTIQEERPVWLTGKEGHPVKRAVKQTIGFEIRAHLKKSKLNSPDRQENFIYSPKTGAIDDWSYLANKALGLGLLGYERGRWWSPEDGVKLAQQEFRGHLPLEDLKKMLQGTVDGVVSAGSAPRGSKKAAVPRRRSSSSTARKPIRTAVPVPSRSTARLKKPSSK